MILSTQPSAPGFDSQMDCAVCTCDTVSRILERDAQSYLFLLQSLVLQLRLGQERQPKGIAITK